MKSVPLVIIMCNFISPSNRLGPFIAVNQVRKIKYTDSRELFHEMAQIWLRTGLWVHRDIGLGKNN